MSAHTPGPWKLKRSGVISAAIDDGVVATCGYRVTASDAGFEDDANAALIAAAPDMLEALRAAVRMLILAGGEGCLAVAESGMSALAKAEGK